jgi:hypothetical protein
MCGMQSNGVVALDLRGATASGLVLVRTRAAGGPLTGLVALSEQSVDPQLNLAGLQAEFFSDGRDRLLVGQMAPDDLGFVCR